MPAQTHDIVFTIYRNMIGTFLTIASIPLETTEVSINTFVRLGSGYKSENEKNGEDI